MTQKDLILAINVSGHLLSHQGFAGQIEALLNRKGVNPKTVKLEVTETALMQNARKSVAKLGRIRTLGVRISMDDLETGYSSLEYLRRLSADTQEFDVSVGQKLDKIKNTIINWSGQ